MRRKTLRAGSILIALALMIAPAVAVADNCSFYDLERPDPSCKTSGVYACMGFVCYDSNGVLTYWEDWGCGCLVYAD